MALQVKVLCFLIHSKLGVSGESILDLPSPGLVLCNFRTPFRYDWLILHIFDFHLFLLVFLLNFAFNLPCVLVLPFIKVLCFPLDFLALRGSY